MLELTKSNRDDIFVLACTSSPVANQLDLQGIDLQPEVLRSDSSGDSASLNYEPSWQYPGASVHITGPVSQGHQTLDATVKVQSRKTGRGTWEWCIWDFNYTLQ